MSKLKVALDLVPEKVGALIADYREELEKAWLKRDDTESLTVTFAAKFGFEKGENVCNVSMAFTPEKITDHTRFTWDDKQLPLLPVKVKDFHEDRVPLKKELKKKLPMKGEGKNGL